MGVAIDGDKNGQGSEVFGEFFGLVLDAFCTVFDCFCIDLNVFCIVLERFFVVWSGFGDFERDILHNRNHSTSCTGYKIRLIGPVFVQ